MAEPAVRDGASATSPQLDKAVPRPPSPPNDQETAQDSKLTEELTKVGKVIQSEIGVSTLLVRLKQTISSARDFSSFLRKRSSLEDEHAQGLKKLARSMHDASLRAENRQGSFARSYDEMHGIHNRMADHGIQFAASIHQMSDDLNELAANLEKGRKQWKQNGLTAEKRVQDADTLAEKAKTKYDSLAEQYDRVKTGDGKTGKFGLKGPRSAAQQEEDTLRKVQQADSDYATKVQSAQTQKQELIATLRPQATNALQELIKEGDSALTMQMQKYATFSEKLLIGSGLSVSPFKDGSAGSGGTVKSLRDAARNVDNDKDFRGFILSQSGKVPASTPPIKYERHAIFSASQTPGAHPKRESLSINTAPAPSFSRASEAFNQMKATPATPTSAPSATTPDKTSAPTSFPQPPSSIPPQLRQASYSAHPAPPHAQPRPSGSVDRLAHQPDLPPVNPVFGVSLEDLFQRDGTAIPMIVYQCIQAIELFGLNVEGIYRLSGNASHISHLKSMFDNDSSKLDFTNPENFYHDVNSVAGLLKQFFRDLPDPLFTDKLYNDFINAARKEDDVHRRDTLHELINYLPDPNYATLRALILHLNHVQERSSENRMNAGNIAISFGLTLMGSNAGRSIADSGWQARVIETVLQNTFQIFDDD